MIRYLLLALALGFLLPVTSTVAKADATHDRYNQENQRRDAERQRDADRANRERESRERQRK